MEEHSRFAVPPGQVAPRRHGQPSRRGVGFCKRWQSEKVIAESDGAVFPFVPVASRRRIAKGLECRYSTAEWRASVGPTPAIVGLRVTAHVLRVSAPGAQDTVAAADFYPELSPPERRVRYCPPVAVDLLSRVEDFLETQTKLASQAPLAS